MLDAYSHVWVMCFAAVWGMLAGRVFAIEGWERHNAILAAGYVGAGTGVLSGPPFALLLTLIARSLPATAATATTGFFATVDEFATAAVLWGPLGGACGGLIAGILVVLLGGGRWTTRTTEGFARPRTGKL
jgi:hypothetical protein